MEKLKLIVVEDEQRILRNIVAKIENAVPNCEIIGTAENGEDAFKLAEKYRPDIVMSDIKMPKMDGIELARLLREKVPGTCVILLSGYSDFEYAKQAMRYGVFYYLLKPLDIGDFQEILGEIHKKLEETGKRTFKNILVSDNSRWERMEQSRDDERHHYFVIAICFSNLYDDVSGKKYSEYYVGNTEEISWNLILENLSPKISEWIIADGSPSNFKNLILTVPTDQELDICLTAKEISRRLHEAVKGVKFDICYHESGIEREKIWNYTQRIRILLENHIVPAVEQVLEAEYLETRPQEQDIFDAVSIRLKNNTKVLLKVENYSVLMDELMTMMNYMIQNHCPLKQVHRLIQNMFRMLEEGVNGLNPAVLGEEKEKFLRVLNSAGEPQQIEEAFCQCMMCCLRDKLDGINYSKDRKAIIEYVDGNYLTIDSVEEVAEQFHYNYTYVSRIFRLEKGISMIKYITEKRMEDARKILTEDPSVKINVLCSRVGYTDQHYFSRVFKNFAGVSPKEFKAWKLREIEQSGERNE